MSAFPSEARRGFTRSAIFSRHALVERATNQDGGHSRRRRPFSGPLLPRLRGQKQRGCQLGPIRRGTPPSILRPRRLGPSPGQIVALSAVGFGVNQGSALEMPLALDLPNPLASRMPCICPLI
jgi:hypothetical protein